MFLEPTDMTPNHQPKRTENKASPATNDVTGPKAPMTVRLLVRGLRDHNPVIRRHMAHQLGRLGPLAHLAIQALMEATCDSNTNVRKEAVRALKAITRAMVPTTSKAAWRRFLRALVKAIAIWPA